MSIFQGRKGIHVEIDRNVHAALRTKLFPMGLSMQQVFEEFARRLVADDSKATRIVDAIIERRVRDAAEGPKHGQAKTKIIEPSELDQDVLYKLIDERLGTSDETD